MKILDYYDIEIFVNDREVEIMSTEFSFSQIDSIYNLFSSGVITFHDKSGLLQEFLMTMEGSKVQINYGINNDFNKCAYVVKKDALEETETRGFLNGMVDMSLVHEWYNFQEIESTAYKDRISNIIRGIAEGYDFKSVDVNDTGNNDIWYQPLITDAAFIVKHLLPNSFSNNSNNTPFFCYITSDNTFHFRNAGSLMSGSPVDTIEYLMESKAELNPGAINAIKRWRDGSDKNRSLRARMIYKLNREDGGLIEEEDSMGLYPQKNGFKLPILNDKGTYSSFLDLDYEEKEIGRKENLKGYIAHTMRDTLFLDRFLVMIPFKPKIRSGDVIKLNIYSMQDEDGTKLSEHYTGNYVVEQSEHIWNGEEQKGFSKLILGRKYVRVPSTYILGKSLMEK